MNRLLILTLAPFIGIMVWLYSTTILMEISQPNLSPVPSVSINQQANDLLIDLNTAESHIQEIESSLSNLFDIYNKSADTANQLVNTASAQVDKPGIIYDNRIISKLGTPTKHIQSENIDLKLFNITEDTYKGYAVKIDLKTDDAMDMVLAKDELGKSETTLQAVQRTGAIAGINAGGFADDWRTGKRYPLSTTIVDGSYVTGFEASFKDLFFVGLDDEGKLIGGNFYNRADLDNLSPQFGATFVPILIQNQTKQSIPSKWLTSPKRAARTVIANYKNDHLLFIVTEGQDSIGKYGASLPELQDKLLELGVIDAYNLDGGGSTSLVINGSTINRPSDGKLRPLPTHFLFFK
ncbi:phosphodiester glycosidase family protein [Chengkuizengella axinellae]|uniref:Phosphodiester glycosidase family protein n=1 Tax=Chengkuizengella axinellae TaxID=3064388 RepID=A0ABT9J0R7_9BACL|nr:phosphodiester glycosidase family protein [Chengkuizengella sp. 2205SS18-9]MDP5275165.1 phosphodiester glycosidase family protein [Chengkuizengella sp. 2205SS18-9]